MGAVPGLSAILLDSVVRAAQAAGEMLRAEFFRPSGPRGERSKAPVDTEMEVFLREALQGLRACSFLGEETGLAPGPVEGWRWVVDPHDGTSEFLKGNRGSAVSIALLRAEHLGAAPPVPGGVPAQAVLGVVHAPFSPDRGPDTIAWAEGCGPVRRNGAAVAGGLERGRLDAGAIVWTTASAALRPQAFARTLAPARFVAMPSIAYRLARVAAGDGVATLSVHSVNEYDIAAGAALVRAAGGVVCDGRGREVAFSGAKDALVSGCHAGAPEAVALLAQKDWDAVLREPKLAPRVASGFPRRADAGRVARAQGCLLGLVIASQDGESRLSADGELALALARAIVREKGYAPAAALAAYREWRDSRSAAACELPSGAAARAAPIGIWAAGDPARAARAAREDAALTHSAPREQDISAGCAAAIAAAIAGNAGEDAIGQAVRSLRVAESATHRAAAAGLQGALHGRASFAPAQIVAVLACRPGAGSATPRPMAYWPDDLLELAEGLIAP